MAKPSKPSGPREFYAVGEHRWICERFDRLAADLAGLTPEQLPAFHLSVSLDARRWRVARHLFGLWPEDPFTDPALDIDEDFRVWSREELKSALTLDDRGLRGELEGIKGLWLARGRAEGRHAAAAAHTKDVKTAAFNGELELKEEDPEKFLTEHGFDPAIFRVSERDEGVNRAERDWFISKVQGASKPLRQAASAELTRRWLLTHLDLRRSEVEFYALKPADGNRKPLLALRLKLQEEERESTKQLQTVAPWHFAAGGNAETMQASYTLLIQATQQMQAGRDPALWQAIHEATGLEFEATAPLVDGIHDWEEVLGMMRMNEEGLRSGQCPQYDLGWVAYVLMCREGLLDPNFKPTVGRKELAALRHVLVNDLEKAFRERGIKIPEITHVGQEYADGLGTDGM